MNGPGPGTPVKPDAAGAFDDLIPAGGATPATPAGGGAFDDLIPNGAGEFGAPTSALQAHVQNLGHGVLSLPATTLGIPAALGHIPESTPLIGGAAPAMAAIGKFLQPATDALQGAADRAAPLTSNAEMGLAGHPTLAKIGRGAEDFIGNTLAGVGAQGIASGVASGLGNVASTAGRLMRIGTKAAPVAGAVGPVATAGVSPEAARLIAGANAAADPAAVAKAAGAPGSIVADAYPELARYARSTSPAARSALDAAYETRDAGRLDRVLQPLEDAVGVPRGNLSQTVDQIAARQKATAQQLFPQAYFNPDGSLRTVSNAAIDDIIQQNPEFQKAWPVARRLVKDEHGVDIGPVPSAKDQSPFNGLTTEQVSNLRSQGVNDAKIADIAKQIGGGPTPHEYPVIGLQYLKEGVDDIVQSNGTTPRIAGLLSRKLEQMRNMGDQQVKEWGAARAAYSTDAKAQEAAALGARDITSPTVTGYDMQQHLTALQPSDRLLYRQTALDQVLQHAENADWSSMSGTDPVKTVLRGIGSPDKLKAIISTPQDYDKFMNALEPVVAQRNLGKFVTAGSQTMDKAQAAKRFDELASPTPEPAAAGATNRSQLATLLRLAQRPVRTAAGLGATALDAAQSRAMQAAADATKTSLAADRLNAASNAGQFLAQPGGNLMAILQNAQNALAPAAVPAVAPAASGSPMLARLARAAAVAGTNVNSGAQ